MKVKLTREEILGDWKMEGVGRWKEPTKNIFQVF
jgi:hypothetical protein